MAKQHVIYNVLGVFAGPAPASGYHFINSLGELHNTPGSGQNLVQPLLRVFGISYDFAAERTDIRALGNRSNIARPILAPPTVNFSIDYYQACITNEDRLGFYVNYAKTPYSTYSGAPYYANNYGVYLLEGFTTKSFEHSDHDLGWPLAYRDKRNIFMAVGKDTNDLNQQAVRTKDVDVVGFGNCYITSYRSSAAVGEVARANVSYVAENMRFYSSGSGATIPALNYDDGTEPSGVVFAIPPLYESSAIGLPGAIMPGDITIDIKSYPETTPRYAYNGWITGGYTGRGNLIPYSRDFTGWNQSGTITDWEATQYWTDIDTYSAQTVTLTSNNINSGIHSNGFYLSSGQTYELSVYAKSGNASFVDIGIHNLTDISWLSFARFDLGTSSTEWINQNYGTNLRIDSLPKSWKRCVFEVTPPYDIQGWVNVFPNKWNVQSGGMYIQLYDSQVRDVEWPEGNMRVGVSSITGVKRTRRIKDIGLNFQDLHAQSYDIGLDLKREPQYALNFKLPADRKLLYPIYSTLNFSMLVGDNNETGSIANLIRDDLNYDVTVKLANPTNKAQTGTAVRYDFIGAKFNSVSYQVDINQHKTASLSFIAELNPDNLAEGMFVSGLHNTLYAPTSVASGESGFYELEGAANDGYYILTEDGGRIKLEN